MDVAGVGGKGSKESERFSGCMLCVCMCVCECASLPQRVTVHWVYVPQDASYQHETSQTFLLNHPVARLAPVNELLAFHLWCLCVLVRVLVWMCAPAPERLCVYGCVRHHALAREAISHPCKVCAAFYALTARERVCGGDCLRGAVPHTHTHTWEESI